MSDAMTGPDKSLSEILRSIVAEEDSTRLGIVADTLNLYLSSIRRLGGKPRLLNHVDVAAILNMCTIVLYHTEPNTLEQYSSGKLEAAE